VLRLDPGQQQRVVEQTGIGFLFAPLYHAGLRHAATTRSELGIPTTFNFLGPLANPAQPDAAAVGVADARMAGLMAGVFAGRGQQGLVVHGEDGLDELTTTTSSQVWVFADGQVEHTQLDPAELGLPRARAEDLVGADAAVNARVVRSVLDGDSGPVRDIVLLNAAAALVAYDKPDAARLADQFADGLHRAAHAIDSGAANGKLAEWVAATRSV
jgi:anthranilate phosphoribosyltransferase